jgi:DNA-binding response OmpR family regulator
MHWAMTRGTILTREHLAALAGHDDSNDIRTVDSHIKRVRQRIPGVGIIAHYGIGYELAEPWASRVKAAGKGQVPA